MQLDPKFLDRPTVPPSAPAAWEQIDEAACMAAIEIQARLISRLLQDEPTMEPSDE